MKSRRSRLFAGIKGLDDAESVVPRLPTIGRLHKGGPMVEREKNGKKYRIMGPDLSYFRFTSDREGLVAAFTAACGEEPRSLNCFLPYGFAVENLQTCCEEWRAGGLVHRCDGETCTVWHDDQGAVHVLNGEEQCPPCPYAGHPELRTARRPGCREVGRLHLIIPELVQAGFVGPVVLVTTSINDIRNLSAALQEIEEERIEQGATIAPLRGVLWTLRRVLEKVSTPGDNGGRVRRPKWLVVIEPAVEWVQMRLAMLREAAMEPRALPPARQGPPGWEDITHPGRTVAEVEEEMQEALQARPGFAEDEAVEGEVIEEEATQVVEGHSAEVIEASDVGEGEAAPVRLEDAHAWLKELRRQAAAGPHGTPTMPMCTKALLMLHDCWPGSPQDAQEIGRHQFQSLALGKAGMRHWTFGEVKALIKALGGDALSQEAATYVRFLVQEAEEAAGQAELPVEEVLDE